MSGDLRNRLLTALGEEFLRSSESFFVDPVLRWFSYLAEDCGFEVKGFAVAHETSVTFHNAALEIAVVFEIPDIPFVELHHRFGSQRGVVSRIRLSRKGPSGGLVRAFERTRNSLTIDGFLDLLRSGQLDTLMDRIIRAYSREVKQRLPDIFVCSCSPQEPNPTEPDRDEGPDKDD